MSSLPLRQFLILLTCGLLAHCSLGSSNENAPSPSAILGVPAPPVLGWNPQFAEVQFTPPSRPVPTGLLGHVLDFGAKCDGVTDDREAIQRALDTVVVIIFPNGGNCVVNASVGSVRFFDTSHRYALAIPSNRTLYLNGSTLTLADDQNAHLFINAQLLTGGGDHDIAIIGPGTINLNKYHQTNPSSGEQSGGFMDQVADLTLRNVTFVHVREYALRHFRIQRGYYDNLICTDSDGSCFAFGIAGVGGPTDSFFGHLEAYQAAGVASVGAVGNPFIAYGSHNTLVSFLGMDNRFGFKIQDGASDWRIGRIEIRRTVADKGVKIMGTRNGPQTQRITVGEVASSSNYYEGLYVWESDDIEIRRVVSKGDGVGAATAGLSFGPTANRIAVKFISVEEAGAGGVLIDGTDFDIGDVYVRNNGIGLPGQSNLAVTSTGQRVRIGSLITVDDQGTSTAAYGLSLEKGATDLDIQSFLAVGAFANAPTKIGATAVRIVDYEAVASTFRDGTTIPSVANGSQFMTANSSPTAIVDFADGVPGQEITVLCRDAQTALVGSLKVTLTAPMTCRPGNVVRFQFNDGAWREIARTLM